MSSIPLFAENELNVFLLIVFLGVMGWLFYTIVMAIERAKAKEEYSASLDALKLDPHNPELREKTLLCGRKYAGLCRDSQGLVVFDEVMVMNDINAACARAGSRVEITSPLPVAKAASPEDRLAKLADLRQRGLITEDEHRTRRQQILAEL